MLSKLKMMKPRREQSCRGFSYGGAYEEQTEAAEEPQTYKTDPKKNASGCTDMTAYKAIRNVTRQEKRVRRNGKKA